MTDNEIADDTAVLIRNFLYLAPAQTERIRKLILSAITAAKGEKVLGLPEADVSAGDATRQKARELCFAVREYTKEREYQCVEACNKDQDRLEKILTDAEKACSKALARNLIQVGDWSWRAGKPPSVPSASPASVATGVSAEGEKLPNELFDVEEWTAEHLHGEIYAICIEGPKWSVQGEDVANGIVVARNTSCATLRAEIARLRKILEEKEPA